MILVAAAAATIATGAVCTSEKLGKPPLASMTCDVTFHNPESAARWILVPATVYVAGYKASPNDDSVYRVEVSRLVAADGKSVRLARLSVESALDTWAVLLPAGATVTVRDLPFSRVGFPAVGATELPLAARIAASAHLDDPTLTPPLAAVTASDDGADVKWSSAKPGARGERDGFSGAPLKLESAAPLDARLRLPVKAP